jgi:hypothetical protein
MRRCSVTKKLQVVPGRLEDYKELAHLHYRDSRLGPFTAIFVLRPADTLAGSFGTKTVGVIVYTMPAPAAELRGLATGNFFTGFDRVTQMALVNKNIRCISRVILEPRFRGLGLATRLVRETLPQMNVPIIEAMAVMGAVNPFFERAGMTAYAAKMPARCARLIEALSLVGIEEEMFIEPRRVQQQLDSLCGGQAEFIELEIRNFLQGYGKRRDMPAGPERTRFVLSKLTFRPVYYIWFNNERQLRV